MKHKIIDRPENLNINSTAEITEINQNGRYVCTVSIGALSDALDFVDLDTIEEVRVKAGNRLYIFSRETDWRWVMRRGGC